MTTSDKVHVALARRSRRHRGRVVETLWCVVRDDSGLYTRDGEPKRGEPFFVLLTFGWFRWMAVGAFVRVRDEPVLSRAERDRRWAEARKKEPGLRVVKVRCEEVVRG